VIRYALRCDHDHAFEAWFGSSTDYDEQEARGLVECPFCASHAIRKQIMAPAVKTSEAASMAPEPDSSATHTMMMEAMGKVRAYVEDNFDYVGDAFADEARAIHEGRSEERGIYGEATPAEVKRLADDGVPVAPLPGAAKRTLN
jgi:hypothetical protein